MTTVLAATSLDRVRTHVLPAMQEVGIGQQGEAAQPQERRRGADEGESVTCRRGP